MYTIDLIISFSIYSMRIYSLHITDQLKSLPVTTPSFNKKQTYDLPHEGLKLV